MEVIAVLAAFVGLIFTWVKVAKKLANKFWLVRHVSGAAAGVFVFFFIGVLSAAVGIIEPANTNTAQNETQSEPEKKKAKFKYEKMLLSEYMEESKGDRKDISDKFVDVHGLPETAEKPFDVCLGDMGRNKSGTLTVGTVLDWCLTDYKNDPALLTRMYVDYDNFEKQFSAWDSSHYKLVALIKSHMNDPDSFQHDKTAYRIVVTDADRYAVITTTFRAKNGFGGMVKNTVVAKTDIDTGNIIEILEQY